MGPSLVHYPLPFSPLEPLASQGIGELQRDHSREGRRPWFVSQEEWISLLKEHACFISSAGWEKAVLCS